MITLVYESDDLGNAKEPDVENYMELTIPRVNNTISDGVVYEVISVEIYNGYPTININENDVIVKYRLPNELKKWVEKVLFRDDGYIPALIEFKIFNGHVLSQSLSSSSDK